jgi:hypothetical protein
VQHCEGTGGYFFWLIFVPENLDGLLIYIIKKKTFPRPLMAVFSASVIAVMTHYKMKALLAGIRWICHIDYTCVIYIGILFHQ